MRETEIEVQFWRKIYKKNQETDWDQKKN